MSTSLNKFRLLSLTTFVQLFVEIFVKGPILDEKKDTKRAKIGA